MGEPEYAEAARKAIARLYTVRDNGFPSIFLGVEMRRTSQYVELTNTKMIDNLMQKFDIVPKLVTSPMLLI